MLNKWFSIDPRYSLVIILCWWLVVGHRKSRKIFKKHAGFIIPPPYYDSERHIRVETDISGDTISGVFSQLTLDNAGWWYLIAFFSQKMITTKTRYESHNGKLLAIVKAFKTWRYYLESSQIKSSCLPTITTSDDLWTWRVWAPNKSARLKNFFVTTFKLFIIGAKQTKLLMPYLDTLSGVLKNKRSSKQRISKSYIAYSSLWPMPAS